MVETEFNENEPFFPSSSCFIYIFVCMAYACIVSVWFSTFEFVHSIITCEAIILSCVATTINAKNI